MRPYYDDGKGIVIYHGDCREIVPQLGGFDLLLTDPPYGINADSRQHKRANKQHGMASAPSRDYGESNWDFRATEKSLLDICRMAATWQIILGGNYFELPPRRGWLVWDKETGENGYADCELAWTNLETAVRKFTWKWQGMLQQNMAEKDVRVHPTQKPVALMA